MSFSPFDLLLVIVFSQGIFLMIAVQIIPNKNKESNDVLSILLFSASIVLLGRMMFLKYSGGWLWKLGAFMDITIYWFGPLLYCYVRRLLFKEDKVYRLEWRHYVLPMLMFTYFLGVVAMEFNQFKDLYASGLMTKVFFIVELLGLASMVYYSRLTYRLIGQFNYQEKELLSYHHDVIRYIHYMLLGLSLFILSWFVCLVSYYGFQHYNAIINYNNMWISLAALMYVIGFYTLRKPEIFRLPLLKPSTKVDTRKNDVKNRISQDEISTLKAKIEKELEDGIYLKSDLKLTFFAERVNTTTNNLSWMLNHIYNKSFYEIINEYRIKDFIEKIENDEHKHRTLLSLAEDVGFNSKSTFNKSFKAIMNDTPSGYIKKLSY